MYGIRLSHGFWDFDSWSKRNVLTDKHASIIFDALEDENTCITQLNAGTFMLCGEEEALLVETTNPVILSTIMLCKSIIACPN